MKFRSKICVVGAGCWGKNHIKTLYSLNSLSGIVDLDSNILNELKDIYPDVAFYANLREALSSNAFSAFIISTPANNHFKTAKEVIEAGYSVLVEKPLTLDYKEAIELKALSIKNGVYIMAGHLLLFHPAIIKIKNLIDLGTIGELQYLYSNRLNLGVVRSKENVFWSFAPHDISLFQYFIQSYPISIESTGGAYLQSQIHDTTLTILKYDHNIQGHIFVSWLHPFKEHRLVIVGSKGMISFEDGIENKPIKLFDKSYDISNGVPEKKEGNVELIHYKNSSPLTEQLIYFIKHLSTGNVDTSNVDCAIDVVKILNTASENLTKEYEET